MPQDIRVLQCFDCRLYQADIVKKSKKWSCKVCGVKQTLRIEYFRGSSAECRAKVQELNKQHLLGVQYEKEKGIPFLTSTNFESVPKTLVDAISTRKSKASSKSQNKWSAYVEDVKQEKLIEPIDEQHNAQFLFNFSNTQKWSTQKFNLNAIVAPVTPDNLKVQNLCPAVQPSKPKIAKASKWDAYT